MRLCSRSRWPRRAAIHTSTSPPSSSVDPAPAPAPAGPPAAPPAGPSPRRPRRRPRLRRLAPVEQARMLGRRFMVRKGERGWAAAGGGGGGGGGGRRAASLGLVNRGEAVCAVFLAPARPPQAPSQPPARQVTQGILGRGGRAGARRQAQERRCGRGHPRRAAPAPARDHTPASGRAPLAMGAAVFGVGPRWGRPDARHAVAREDGRAPKRSTRTAHARRRPGGGRYAGRPFGCGAEVRAAEGHHAHRPTDGDRGRPSPRVAARLRARARRGSHDRRAVCDRARSAATHLAAVLALSSSSSSEYSMTSTGGSSSSCARARARGDVARACRRPRARSCTRLPAGGAPFRPAELRREHEPRRCVVRRRPVHHGHAPRRHGSVGRPPDRVVGLLHLAERVVDAAHRRDPAPSRWAWAARDESELRRAAAAARASK